MSYQRWAVVVLIINAVVQCINVFVQARNAKIQRRCADQMRENFYKLYGYYP